MDPLTARRRAEGAFVSVLAKVGPDQAGAPTPRTEWSVRDVVAHVVAGNWWLAGGQPRQVPDDIEGLIGAYAASAEAAYSVLAAPHGLERPAPLGTASAITHGGRSAGPREAQAPHNSAVGNPRRFGLGDLAVPLPDPLRGAFGAPHLRSGPALPPTATSPLHTPASRAGPERDDRGVDAGVE